MYVNERQIAIGSQWISATGKVVVVTHMGRDSISYIQPDDTEHAVDCFDFMQRFSPIVAETDRHKVLPMSSNRPRNPGFQPW